ncbi:MAG: RNA polymerase sigma factor [Clostridia bacterium]|nr:RNA polymerase sigma factor [Clostridia bacterium]
MPYPLKKTEPAETMGENALLEAHIESLALGDVNAIGPIYDMTRTSVYAYCLSLLKNSAEAEDAMHDCYLRIHSSASLYKPNGKPMAWIITIARNLCLSRLRELKKHVKLPDEDWHELLRTDEISTNLHAADMLNALGDTERQIVLLHTISGFKHREIAEIMGLPLATVLTKYSRAIKKLRRMFKEGEGEK